MSAPLLGFLYEFLGKKSEKALADWGAASNLFYTMGDTRLLSSLPWRKAFSDYIFNRNNNEGKKNK